MGRAVPFRTHSFLHTAGESDESPPYGRGDETEPGLAGGVTVLKLNHSHSLFNGGDVF